MSNALTRRRISVLLICSSLSAAVRDNPLSRVSLILSVPDGLVELPKPLPAPDVATEEPAVGEPNDE